MIGVGDSVQKKTALLPAFHRLIDTISRRAGDGSFYDTLKEVGNDAFRQALYNSH